VRRWQFGLTLLLPILLTLVASALQKYPFWGRLLLFLTPITFLLVAEAIGRMQWLFNRLTGVPWAGLPIAAALLAWVAITPASHGAEYLWKPRLVEEMKPIMSYLSEHRRHNDAVYVYYAAAPAFRYYLPFYNLDEVHVLWGTTNREHPADYFLELNKLRGRGRVWIVFSHNFNGNATDEKTLFLDYLEEIGKRSEKFNTDGAWLALYDLQQAAEQRWRNGAAAELVCAALRLRSAGTVSRRAPSTWGALPRLRRGLGVK
jgi:hypothetical protein